MGMTCLVAIHRCPFSADWKTCLCYVSVYCQLGQPGSLKSEDSFIILICNSTDRPYNKWWFPSNISIRRRQTLDNASTITSLIYLKYFVLICNISSIEYSDKHLMEFHIFSMRSNQPKRPTNDDKAIQFSSNTNAKTYPKSHCLYCNIWVCSAMFMK